MRKNSVEYQFEYTTATFAAFFALLYTLDVDAFEATRFAMLAMIIVAIMFGNATAWAPSVTALAAFVWMYDTTHPDHPLAHPLATSGSILAAACVTVYAASREYKQHDNVWKLIARYVGGTVAIAVGVGILTQHHVALGIACLVVALALPAALHPRWCARAVRSLWCKRNGAH